jgi:agmatinase
MSKEDKIKQFNPSGIGLKNSNFIGLPFDESEAEIVLLPVPWDVTVSFAEGTSSGPQNILNCSSQLDLYDSDLEDAWKIGIFMKQPDSWWVNRNRELRKISKSYIDFLERGGRISDSIRMEVSLNVINEDCNRLNQWVYKQTSELLKQGKKVGVVGGEHSVPLGYMKALAERHSDFGVLQIDAHQDLRKAYEGLTYSHASIFYNALEIPSISRLVQVGIRDTCEAEITLTDGSFGRIMIYSDQTLKERQFTGESFHHICSEIVEQLPPKVYISFDIDGLVPELCPNTGTPVPGGLQFWEAVYLIKTLANSGREIIGFDLCEVAGTKHEWDGNVGARVLYKLCNLMWKSGLK